MSEWFPSLSSWWAALGLELQFFYTIGIISTFIVLIQALLLLVGVGSDVDVDDAGDLDDASDGLRMLSIRTIVAFLMGFGWAGVIALKSGIGLTISVVLAVLIGLIFMAGIFFLLRTLYSLGDSGTLDYRNAIGETATVYLPIPANESGPGEVEVMVQGRLQFVKAYTPADRKLTGRTHVLVIGLMDDQTLLVEPLQEEPEKRMQDQLVLEKEDK